MSTLYENGQLQKGYRVPSTYIKTLIPNFEEVFGKHTDLLCLMETLAPPQIEIRTNQTKFNVEGSLRILNPYRDEFDAVVMKFEVKADFEFELLQDFSLVGNITDIDVTVTEFTTFFKSRVNAGTVNR